MIAHNHLRDLAKCNITKLENSLSNEFIDDVIQAYRSMFEVDEVDEESVKNSIKYVEYIEGQASKLDVKVITIQEFIDNKIDRRNRIENFYKE